MCFAALFFLLLLQIPKMPRKTRGRSRTTVGAAPSKRKFFWFVGSFVCFLIVCLFGWLVVCFAIVCLFVCLAIVCLFVC